MQLVRKTRKLGFNLSKTFENQLKQLINHFYSVYTQNNSEKKMLFGAGGREFIANLPVKYSFFFTK